MEELTFASEECILCFLSWKNVSSKILQMQLMIFFSTEKKIVM